jgi:hypothetical protein
MAGAPRGSETGKEGVYAVETVLLRRNATDGHRFERQPGLPEAEPPRQSPVRARGAERSHLPARISDLATFFEESGPESGVRMDASLHPLRHLISFGFGMCCFHIDCN